MRLPRYLTTVTPFSKFLAYCLFIAFPLLAFWFGMYYQKLQPAKVEYITEEKIVKVFPTETQTDLVNRCGDYPVSVLEATPCGQFNSCGGPKWSDDCRYIAWSLNRSVPSWEGPLNPGETITPFEKIQSLSDEGVFLYEDKTGLVKTIYHPDIKKDARTFREWADSKTVDFISESETYFYDVLTGEITSNPRSQNYK